MSDDPSRRDPPTEFDWESPRWRDPDAEQGETEREHRFRDDPAQAERGAIDRGNSVGRRRQREQPANGERP